MLDANVVAISTSLGPVEVILRLGGKHTLTCNQLGCAGLASRQRHLHCFFQGFTHPTDDLSAGRFTYVRN